MSKRGNGEGSIYRRASDGRWVGTLPRHFGVPPVYGKRRSEVVDKLAEVQKRLDAGEPVRDTKATMGSFITNDWLVKALPASARRAMTQDTYSSLARTHLVPPPFGSISLDKLRPSDVEALLVAKRAAGLSEWTVRAIYTVCRQALDIAVRDGLIRRNSAALVKRPTVARHDAHYLTPDEAGRLLEAAREDRLYPLLVLLLGTGLRRGEALALHWSDVDLDVGIMRVRLTLSRVHRELVFDEPKTEKSRRFVSLPAPVVEILRKHKATMHRERLATRVWTPWSDHEDLVFPTKLGTPTEPRNALRSLHRIAEHAGLAEATLHTLRHSTASALIRSGTHMKVVQELLGHSSYAFTADIYSHVAIEQQREAADRLGEAFTW
jgi:integrase